MHDTTSAVADQETIKHPFAAIVRNSVRVIALIIGACALVGEILTIIYMLHGAPGTGDLGASFRRTAGPGQQHVIVTAVSSGSPLAVAGVHTGDALQFDNAMDDGYSGRRFGLGEQIGLTILGPATRHISVAASIPHSDTPAFIQLIILDCMTSMLSISLGALIMLRARGSNAMVALGLAFTIFASFSTLIPQNQTPLVFFLYSLGFQSTQAPLATLALLYFAVTFYRENNGTLARWVWPAFWLYALVVVIVNTGWTVLSLSNYTLPFMEHSDALTIGCTELGFVPAIAGLVIGWQRSRQDLQKRYAVMTVAIATVILCDVMFVWSFNAIGGFGNPRFQLWYTIAEWLSAAGHLLFAYAVLRDRVIDLGFVINRAVVYGVISALLLVAFGLVEWGAEKVIPEGWLEQSKAWKDVLDALIALGVYLVFHRVRDSVERFIENLFFHKWHANEEALRRFVKEADFISQPDALVAAFTAELRRFTGQQGQVVYVRDEDGRFIAVSGRGGAVDIDDPALVAMRARHAAVEPERLGSKLHAALALPMSHRGEVFGFVLVPAKSDGNGYRPDETEVLQWAAHQVGLDYHALEVESVRRDAASLREQNAALNAVIERAMGKGRKAAAISAE